MQEVVCGMAGSIGTGVLPAPACFTLPTAGGMRGLELAGSSGAAPHLCEGEGFKGLPQASQCELL